MRTEVSRFTSPFQWPGADSPNCFSHCFLLFFNVAVAQTHASKTCIYMEVSLLPWFCSLSRSVNAHGELAVRFSPHLITSIFLFFPTLPLFTHCPSLCLCLHLGLYLCPLLFYSRFLTPALPSPPSCLLSRHLPPVVLVCALVCHEGGGG